MIEEPEQAVIQEPGQAVMKESEQCPGKAPALQQPDPVELACAERLPDDSTGNSVCTMQTQQLWVQIIRPCHLDQTWLNEEVLVFFLEWWCNLTGGGGGSKQVHVKPDSNPKCWYASTYFLPKLAYDEEVKGYFFESVQRWMLNVDLFSQYDKLKQLFCCMLLFLEKPLGSWVLYLSDTKKSSWEKLFSDLVCQKLAFHLVCRSVLSVSLFAALFQP